MRLTDLAMNMSNIKLTGLCQSQAAFHFLDFITPLVFSTKN